jgi:hypothetical protein
VLPTHSGPKLLHSAIPVCSDDQSLDTPLQASVITVNSYMMSGHVLILLSNTLPIISPIEPQYASCTVHTVLFLCSERCVQAWSTLISQRVRNEFRPFPSSFDPRELLLWTLKARLNNPLDLQMSNSLANIKSYVRGWIDLSFSILSRHSKNLLLRACIK